IAVLPAAAEDATEPEPTTQTQEEPAPPAQEDATEPAPPAQEETTEPAVPASHKPLSPYHLPEWEDYDGDWDAWKEDYEIWRFSVYARYYSWRGSDTEEIYRASFEPVFRTFYADDPELSVVDHFVFKKFTTYVYENKKRVKRTFAWVLDYFDTDEAEQACTTLRIPAELDGCRVQLDMWYSLSDDTDATRSIGYRNDVVKKLVIEEGPTTVSNYAFANFTALKTVYLPASVHTITRGAFQNCTNLKKVVVRGNLDRIGARAFEGCERLRSFDALEQVKNIEGRAFANSGLRSVTLRGDVWLNYGDEDADPIGYNFIDCKELKTVQFLDVDSDDALHYLVLGWHCFDGCTALDTVTLPLGVKRIDIYENAFAGCTALRAVQHVTNLKTVYSNAFLNCRTLDTFVLPRGIEFAEADAFKGCTALKRFFVNSKNANLLKYKDYDDGDYRGRSINGNFLASLPKDCTIFVVNKEMKYVFKTTGFKGAVKIRVNVPTPKTARMTRQNGKVRFVWSTVTKADGYRIWSYDARAGKYTRLATVKAPKTSVTLKTNARQFVIRAYQKEAGDVSWSAVKTFK
ncbi:MAG: leucine-rich repeat protein, partial [Clostridia bacterium]|nr:leucine-rich repeat protein [Clostridia bacterium]